LARGELLVRRRPARRVKSRGENANWGVEAVIGRPGETMLDEQLVERVRHDPALLLEDLGSGGRRSDTEHHPIAGAQLRHRR